MASAQIISLQSTAATSRRTRRPKHKFQVRVKPYQIAPFMIAPVLPGETLTQSYFECREVTDPIKHPLVGWNSEWFLFYVKIRDLHERDTLDDLFIEPAATVSALNAAADPLYYHQGDSPNYAKLALRRIVETYFRDEGEAWNNADIAGLPSAQFRDQGWMQSLVDTTVLSAGVGDPGAATTPEALDKLMDAYEYLRSMNLMDMEFDDYLRTFGVRISKAEQHKPELIATWKEFQYPSNTVEPTTGVPSSAVSWVQKKLEKKKMFFKEPGFILGVHIVRPKIYFGRQFGSMTHFLDQGLSWLPAIMKDSPETSLREFTGAAAGTSPLSNDVTGPTNGFWVDMRDLFLYGDQFINYAMSDTTSNFIAAPTAGLQRKYPTEADMDGLFSSDTKELCRSDGFLSLDILGGLMDHTPTTNAEAL